MNAAARVLRPARRGHMTGQPPSVDSLTESGREDLFRVLFLAVLAVSVIVLVTGLFQPLLGFHPFRQTQTAIATWWMLNGSSWINYETPVLGAPWSIPFEFPLYNWLVAGLVKVTGIPLDAAGRLVSFSWMLLCLIPAGDLMKSYGFASRTRIIFAALFLAAPTYLYWGRSFLMETQALFLCLAFLACIRRMTLRPGQMLWPLLAIAAGTGATLTKVTTGLPYFLLAGLIVALDLLQRFRNREPWLQPMFVAGVSAGIPVAVFWIWNHHADGLKSANDIAAYFQSGTPEMKAWNFGTLADRFTTETLRAFERGLLDTFGWFMAFLLPALAGLVVYVRGFTRRDSIIVGCLVAGFLAPWAVIAPLYVVHHYYQTGSAIFAIAAAAIAVSAIVEARPKLGLAICVALISSQFLWFSTKYAPTMSERGEDNLQYQIARYVHDNTPADGVVVIHGSDWSSMIPYYSERRAVMEPEVMLQAPRAAYLARLNALDELVGGHAVTAFVRCPSRLDADPEAAALLDAIARGNNTVRFGACDVSIGALPDAKLAPPAAAPVLRRFQDS